MNTKILIIDLYCINKNRKQFEISFEINIENEKAQLVFENYVVVKFTKKFK